MSFPWPLCQCWKEFIPSRGKIGSPQFGLWFFLFPTACTGSKGKHFRHIGGDQIAWVTFTAFPGASGFLPLSITTKCFRAGYFSWELHAAPLPRRPEEHKRALFPPHCSLALHFSQLLLTSSSPCWLESCKPLISTSFDKQEVGKKSIIFRIRASEWIEERKGEEGKKRKRALHTFLIAR